MLPRVVLFLGMFLFASSSHSRAQVVDARLVTDEAEAVLAILAKKKANEAITQADWSRVFSSEGYTRLKKRELSMQRPFADAEFQKFVLSEDLVQRGPALEATLARWRRADVSRSAELALAYLPAGSRIRAKIYPVIKPRDNSFVFEVKNDPAIFLFLDPAVAQKKFENTLAHELHHIGYGASCVATDTSAAGTQLSSSAQTVLTLIGAFGEGFAMLAAAGGPSIHPHEVSDADERARWDQNLKNFNSDLKKVEDFFLRVLDGRLAGADIQKEGFSFFGTQGPWYTVGWRMATLIEQTYGRKRLVEVICDQRRLLATYNEAAVRYNRNATEPLATWSESVVTLK